MTGSKPPVLANYTQSAVILRRAKAFLHGRPYEHLYEARITDDAMRTEVRDLHFLILARFCELQLRCFFRVVVS